ncbi:MAG: serine hydroxymethyltransferase, partial [Deltaproteobacteria bacterium]
GTDNHLMLVDLTNKKISGKRAAKALDQAGIVLNYNSVPFDRRKPFDPSGIRLGTPALTSRGFKEGEMVLVSEMISKVINDPDNVKLLAHTAAEVKELCRNFPAPGLELLN